MVKVTVCLCSTMVTSRDRLKTENKSDHSFHSHTIKLEDQTVDKIK